MFGVKIGEMVINNFRCTDDTIKNRRKFKLLKILLNKIKKAIGKAGLELNLTKMTIGTSQFFKNRWTKSGNSTIPIGSHKDPISIVDDKLLWKKKKKVLSEK